MNKKYTDEELESLYAIVEIFMAQIKRGVYDKQFLDKYINTPEEREKRVKELEKFKNLIRLK